MAKIFAGFDANGKKIHLTPDDRKLHMHVIGSSGSGKSKFLEWLIRRDIRNEVGFFHQILNILHIRTLQIF